MTKYLRKLNVTEMISWIISQQYPHHLIVAAHVRGQFCIDKIRAIIGQVQQENSMLQVNTEVKDGQVFLKKISSCISITAIKRNHGDDWKNQCNNELRLPFPKDSPLARLTFIYDETGFDILLTFHHMIADGLGGVWIINKLINSLNKNSDENDVNPIIEPADLQGKHIDFFPTCILDKIDEHEENITQFIHFNINKGHTHKLLKYCKRKNINIHSIISAAACIALNEAREIQQPIAMRYSAPVNMRPQYQIEAENFSALSAWVDCSYPINAQTSLLGLAMMIYADIKYKLHNNEPQNNIKELYNLLQSKSINAIFNNVTTQPLTTMVSNMGRIESSDHGSYQLRGIHIIANSQKYLATKDAILLIITNLNGTNFCNLCFAEKYMSKEKAQSIANTIINKLADELRENKNENWHLFTGKYPN